MIGDDEAIKDALATGDVVAVADISLLGEDPEVALGGKCMTAEVMFCGFGSDFDVLKLQNILFSIQTNNKKNLVKVSWRENSKFETQWYAILPPLLLA